MITKKSGYIMKTRKQRNAVILSVPSQFNIPEGKSVGRGFDNIISNL